MTPQLQQLINDMDGKGPWYVTGPDSGQCTAVPHEWEQRLGLPIVYGNAVDTYNNAPDSLYEKELNSPVNFPRPGAIIVWNGNWGGGAGHTAVIISANPDTFTCLEQNDPDGSWVHQGTHNYADIIGWFYPRVLDVPVAQPTPDPTPAPVPDPVVVPEPAPEVPVPSPDPSTPVTPVVTVDQPDPTESIPVPITITSSVPTIPVKTANASNPILTSVVSQVHTVIMKDQIIQKLISRKFWVTVAGVIAALANNDINAAALIVIGYLGIQGAIDHKNAG